MIEVAAAVIISNGMVFLSSRPADKPPAGWEFPGGNKRTAGGIGLANRLRGNTLYTA